MVLLVTLAAPTRNLQLGLTDQSSAPKDTTVRQAYDQLTDSFGPGANGPLLVMADLGSKKAEGADDPRLVALRGDLAAAPGAAAVGEPQVSKDGTAAMISVISPRLPVPNRTGKLVSFMSRPNSAQTRVPATRKG